MKTIVLISFFLSFYTFYSQPTPEVIIPDGINLNDIPDEKILKCNQSRFCSKGTIVIDSTTNLNNLYKLADFENLDLTVKINALPINSLNWKTKSLTINGNNILSDFDISSLQDLENVSIQNYIGKSLSKGYLKLSQLNSIYLSQCPNLQSLNEISSLKNLKQLHIDELTSLRSFPKFKRNNIIEELSLDKTTNSIKKLKYLRRLKKLYLRIDIDAIPYSLPESIEELAMGNSLLKTELKDLNALNSLPKLKVFRFGSYYVTDTISTFHNIELERLEFNLSSGNINFIFRFKKIRNLVSYGDSKTNFGINNFNNLNYITKFENIYIFGLKNTPNLNPLLETTITNSLSIKYSDIQILTDIETLKKIPNVLIENNKKLEFEEIVLSKDWKIINNGSK